MKQAPPVVLSIAGYDPSSGAGVTADIKTAAAHDCYAVTCITAVTVQTSRGVSRVEPLDPEIVGQSLFELAADVPIAAVRIGMLGSGQVAEAVAVFLEAARPPNVVLDPVLSSSSGKALLDERGIGVLKDRLLRLATVVTPNAEEASMLTECEVRSLKQAREAGEKLLTMVQGSVVVTGGHLPENVDLLLWKERSGNTRVEEFGGERIDSSATHGTGCAFASAIACNLALGKPIIEAVRGAKEYVREAIEAAYPLGSGHGPMNHLFKLDE